MSWQDKEWDYKGYRLSIDFEHENGSIKAYHRYWPLDKKLQKSKIAYITPYDSDARTFELYIDCIEAGADPKGSHVQSKKGQAIYTSWDKKALQDYAIKFIVNGRSRY